MCIVWLYHTCFFSEAMLYCHAMQHIGTRQRGHQPGKPGKSGNLKWSGKIAQVRENVFLPLVCHTASYNTFQ